MEISILALQISTVAAQISIIVIAVPTVVVQTSMGEAPEEVGVVHVAVVVMCIETGATADSAKNMLPWLGVLTPAR